MTSYYIIQHHIISSPGPGIAGTVNERGLPANENAGVPSFPVRVIWGVIKYTGPGLRFVADNEENCLCFTPNENDGFAFFVGSCDFKPHVPGSTYLAGAGPLSMHDKRGFSVV